MPTRNINLTDHYDGFVAGELDTGHYNNASEVIRAGLHLLEKQKQEDEAKLEALRREALVGLEAYERGDYTALDTDEAFDKFFDDIAEDHGLKD